MPATLTIEVTRTELSLPPLALTAGSYKLEGTRDADRALQVDAVVYETAAATSPWMHGDVAVARKKVMSNISLNLLVCSSSVPAISAALDVLIDAVSQWTYQMTVRDPATNTAIYAWTCWPADYAVGFLRVHHWGRAAPVTLIIPRQPVPVLGPY